MKKPTQPNASFYPHSLHRSVVGRQTKTEAPRKTRLQQLQTENTQLKIELKNRTLQRDLLKDTAEMYGKECHKLEGRLADIQQIINETEKTNPISQYDEHIHTGQFHSYGKVYTHYDYENFISKLLERLRGALKIDK